MQTKPELALHQLCLQEAFHSPHVLTSLPCRALSSVVRSKASSVDRRSTTSPSSSSHASLIWFLMPSRMLVSLAISLMSCGEKRSELVLSSKERVEGNSLWVRSHDRSSCTACP